MTLCAATAAELVDLVRSGTAGRREVLGAHFDRIEAVNGEVGAIVELRDREAALAEADAADRERAGRSHLPLDGVPITLKDHFDVEGMRRTDGVRAFADRRSPRTTLVVERLREAGAAIVGKCNEPDFKVRWNTISDLYGATRNPHDLGLSVGGSSGGDAAAVAAGMAPIGMGTDYGGSIRVPAGFCGVWGLRPTPGRVPDVVHTEPRHWPPTRDLMSSVGALSRSLDDLRVVYDVIRGPSPSDPASVPAAYPPTEGSGLRVARVDRQTGAAIEPEIEERLEQVADILADAGYEAVDGDVPGGPRLPELWGELVGTELIRTAMPVWRELMGESGRQHAEEMFGIFELGDDVARYVAAFVERRALAAEVAEWMEEHPLVIAPVAGMPTPPLDFDHQLSTEATRELFDRMRNALWVNLLGLPAIALPNGIQLVARRFHEDELFAAAGALASALPPVAIAYGRTS